MKQRIFIILIIFLSTTLVYSKGSQEKSQIEIAKELLEEKKYNEAIALLTTYMSDNPAVIYEVQPLLDDIREKRDENNRDMDELIHVLYDLEDIDAGYKLIQEIEENNPYPDELSKQFLRNAREGATFVINQKKFKSYMDQAYIHLTKHEFNEALDNYMLCLDFHNDEFDLLMEAEEGEITEETSLEVIDEEVSLNSYYTSLKKSSFKEVDLIEEHTEELKSYLNLLKESYERSVGIIDSESLDRESLAVEMNIFREVPTFLDLYNDRKNQIGQYNNLFGKISVGGVRSKYMSYATLTLTGRKERSEGILHLVETLYPYYLDDLITRIENRIESNLSSGINHFKEGRYSDARTAFNSGINNNIALEETASVWKGFIKIDKNFNIVGKDILKEKYKYLGDSQVGNRLFGSYLDLTDYLDSLENRREDEDLESYREFIVNQIVSVNNERDYWENERDRVNSREELLYDHSPKRIESLLNEFLLAAELHVEKEIDVLDRLSQKYYVDIFEEDIIEDKEIEDVMANIINNAAEPTDTPENINVYFGINSTDERTITTFNPETALEDLNSIEREYELYIEGLEEYIDKFRNEKDYIFANYNFNTRFNNVQTAYTMASDNRERLLNLKNSAIDKITLSKESEIRGFALYDRAVNAFDNERFSEAREIIDTGKNVSEIAISYSKNRTVIDDLIPSFYNLEDRITQEEARIVIRDVRRLINQGKTQYLEGAYIPASNLFREAELRWSETNSDAHPEIPYWLALIRDAMDIESGRYLSITEPLYSVLAGYLDFAEKYYRTGLKESNKVNMLKSFALADSYLVKVLEVRPLNERARFLQLQVLKSKDPEAFKIIFNNDFTRYRNTVLRAIENESTLSNNSMLSVLGSYEEIIRDSYLSNPRLSGTVRRRKLERFYKPVDTSGKSASQITREKNEIEDSRKKINESYIRFKDLYKIAEGDQRSIVKRLMDISEVALGFRRLPVDTSNIRKSNAIFVQAKAKFESTNQSEVDTLNTILADLKKALSLNPGNEDIPVVIDEILVALGEESNFQLQPNEDKLFREAQRDFIDGRYFDAKDKIIDILRADRKNKNYPKLKELINRVEVKLKEEIIIQ